MYVINSWAYAHVKAVLANKNYSHMEDANQRQQQISGDCILKTAGATWAAKMMMLTKMAMTT